MTLERPQTLHREIGISAVFFDFQFHYKDTGLQIEAKRRADHAA